MSGLSIDVGANTRAAQSGVRDLSKAVDDTADALDDLAREGDQAGNKLERTFREMVNDAKKADRAVEDIGDGGKRGFGKASEAAGEFKQEALQNLSEVTSSFNGDMQSIGDLAQGTFGGLASSLPGALGAAGAGAAVGVGLITAGFVAADEARQKLQERAGELANAYIEAGSTVLDAMTIAGRTAEILTDPEQRKGAEELRELIGIDLPTAARALAGDQNALALANKLATAATAENVRLNEQQLAASSKRKSAVSDEILQNERVIEGTRRLNEITDIATQQFNDNQEALRGIIRDAGTATEEVDEFGNKLLTLPDTTQVLIDAETGQATTNVSKFKGDVDGITDTVTTTAVFDDTQARRDYAAFRQTVTQRLGIPTVMSAPSGIARWD